MPNILQLGHPPSRPAYFITYHKSIETLREAYSPILATSEAHARQIALREVGTCFDFLYTEPDVLAFHPDWFSVNLAVARQVLINQGALSPSYPEPEAAPDLGETPMTLPETPLDHQPGGTPYVRLAYQPIEYAMDNQLDPCAFSMLRYCTRLGAEDKGQDLLDLDKTLHYLDLRQYFRDQYIPQAGPQTAGLRIPMARFAGQSALSDEAAELLHYLGLYLEDDSAASAFRTRLRAIKEKLETPAPRPDPARKPSTARRTTKKS